MCLAELPPKFLKMGAEEQIRDEVPFAETPSKPVPQVAPPPPDPREGVETFQPAEPPHSLEKEEKPLPEYDCPYCEQPVPDRTAVCPSCGLTLPDEYHHSGPEYAGLAPRGIAYLVDAVAGLVLMGLLAIPFTVLLGLPSLTGLPADPSQGFFMMKLFVAVGLFSKLSAWFYCVWFESSRWQATPGKMLAGIVVTDLEGNRITFSRANKRYWAKMLSDVLYLGYAFIAISEKKQGLHDRIARTVVVYN